MVECLLSTWMALDSTPSTKELGTEVRREGGRKREKERGRGNGKGHSSALPVATSHLGSTEVELGSPVLHLTCRVETLCSVGPGDDQISLPSRQS